MSNSKRVVKVTLGIFSTLAVLFLSVFARDARADALDFTGVVACTDTTLCSGSSNFTITGTYDYDPTTETVGAFSFVTPFGTIADMPAAAALKRCAYVNGQRVCSGSAPAVAVGLDTGSFALVFFGDSPLTPVDDSLSLALIFDGGSTGEGSILTNAVFGQGSILCELYDCPLSSGSSDFNFTSGTATRAVTPSPEGSSLALFCVGLVGLVGLRMKKSTSSNLIFRGTSRA